MNKTKREASVKGYWLPLFFIFGVYLLVGGVVAIVKGAWPIFMPPQLDIIGAVFSIFGDLAASILGGIFLGALGFGFIYLSFLGARK